MDYVTIATTGNAIDFGDMTVGRWGAGSCANGTRGIWAGGNSGSTVNVIDYVTIQTTGNAVDFGDLAEARDQLTGLSGD